MRAGEHQREPLVRDLCRTCGCLQPFGYHLQLLVCQIVATLSAEAVDYLASGHCQQPRFWICRAAMDRPVCQCRKKGFRECVLRGGYIFGTCREKGHQLAITA